MMLESVTYADLQFAGSPPEKSHGEEPNDGELTYENIQPSQAQEGSSRACQEATGCSDWCVSPGWSCQIRCTALGMLGISLFLFSIIISLGVQYLQASQQLQEAFQDHAAERHFLGERVYVLQTRLDESQHLLRRAEEELNSTAGALQESQAAENQTQWQLQHQELQLGEANLSLALLQKETESLKTKVSRATSCQQIGCCPQGWKLFRWKCLRISDLERRWEDSNKDCKVISSQLFILKKPWYASDVWAAGSLEQSNHYWIGLKKSWSSSSFSWVDQTSYNDISMNRGSGNRKHCVDLHKGTLNLCSCDEMKKYICEKPASPQPVHVGL